MTKEVLKLALEALEDENSLSKMETARGILRKALAQPDHDPQHTYTLQEMLAQLHLYEEINEHYAKCNPGPEALRDWVVERMDKPPLPVQPQRKWVGLTDEDKSIILQHKWWNFEDEFDLDGLLKLVEAKLKGKNT